MKASSADLLHLHWINGGALSIRAIGSAQLPTVWTLHDMWPIAGALHYDDSAALTSAFNTRIGIDLDRRLMIRKLKAWQESGDLAFIAPSRWMANSARLSPLSKGRDVFIVPNALPTHVFRPHDRRRARDLLGLPLSRPLIGFGADGGAGNELKGWTYLARAHARLSRREKIGVVTFGGSDFPGIGADSLLSLGRIDDDQRLALLYAAIDVLVVPSIMENLPQVATESISCGTPVVAFDIGGLKDVVSHPSLGVLAEPYDDMSLATAIETAFSLPSDDQNRRLRHAHADSLWSYPVIAKRHADIYTALLRERGGT